MGPKAGPFKERTCEVGFDIATVHFFAVWNRALWGPIGQFTHLGTVGRAVYTSTLAVQQF